MGKKVIRPVRDRSGIITGAKMKTVSPNGEETSSVSHDEGAFLSGSLQVRRPVWSKGAQEFLLHDMSDKRLNELVKQLKWKDDDGDTIESADRRNMHDPFFNHINLTLMLNAGKYDPEGKYQAALEEILMSGMQARYDSTSYEEMDKSGGAFTQEQRFQIEDEEVKAKSENKSNRLKVELTKAYAKVITTQKKALITAKLLNLQHSEDIEMFNLENLIMHEVVENGNGRARHFEGTRQEALVTISKCTDEEIALMEMLKKGVTSRKLEFRNDGWFMGNPPENVMPPEKDFYKLTQYLIQNRGILDDIDAHVNEIR